MAPGQRALENGGGRQDDPPTAAIIYAAKSTEDTRRAIDTQLANCRAAIHREGRVILDEFTDEGFSAWKRNRGPGLANALRAVKRATEHYAGAELWVEHSDRLARGDGERARHLVELFLQARQEGFRLRSVEDDANLSDILHAVLIGERNAEDSRRKAEAVKSGKRRTFEAGNWNGGAIPDGYRVEREFNDRGHAVAFLVVDEERAAIVRLIFHLAEEGHGDAAIARHLNAGGYRTKPQVLASGCRAGEVVPPKPWSRRRVQDTVTNPVYAGAVIWHRGRDDEEVNWNGKHQPLVTRESFDAIEGLRARRDRAVSGRPKGGRHTSRYMLSKLAECGRCGARMYCRTSPYKRKKKGGTQARRYVCANVLGQTGLCDCPAIDAELVDRTIRLNLRRMVLDFEAFLDAALETHARDVAGIDDAIAKALEEIDTLDTKLGRVEKDYLDLLDGDDDEGEAKRFLLRALPRLSAKRREVDALVAELRRKRDELLDRRPHDAALDTFNARRQLLERLERALTYEHTDRAGFREQAWGLQHLDEPKTTERANDALRAAFSAFRLDIVKADGLEALAVEPMPLDSGDPLPNGYLVVDGGRERVRRNEEALVQTGNASQEQRLVCTSRWFPRFLAEWPPREQGVAPLG